jgi:O-antigen/teichoic acid export membrane protein
VNRIFQVLINALSNYGRFFISILIMGLLTPYLVEKLGTDDFGLWSLTLSFLGFFSLLDLGLGAAVVKYVAECRGARDHERRNQIVSTLFVAYIALTLISVLILGALSPFYGEIMNLPVQGRDKALMLLWLMAFRLVFVPLPMGMYRSVLHGEQKFYSTNMAQVVSLTLYGVGAYVVLERGGDIIDLALVQIATMLVEYLAYWFLSVRSVDHLQIRFGLASKAVMKEVWGFSTAALFVNVAGLILLRTDPLIIKLYLPLSAVAIYAVALKVAEALLMLLKQFINVLSPLIAELKGEGENEKIKFIFLNCTRFALAPGLAAGLFLMYCAEPLLRLWVGPDFSSGDRVLQILVVSVLLSVPQMIASNVLAMTGYHKVTAKAAGQSAAINVVLSLILVVQMGLEGVALATLIATLVIDIVVVLRAACSLYEISLLDYFRRVIFPLTLPTLLQLAALYGMSRLKTESIWVLLLLGGCTALLFLVAFGFFSLEKSERELIKKKLSRR